MRNRDYNNPILHCEHESHGYCDACWRNALARELTPNEWAAMHRKAANQPRGTVTRKYPALKSFTPAKAWNGTAVINIAKRIEDSIEDTIRTRTESWSGKGAHGYTIVKTDGYRLLANRSTIKAAALNEADELLSDVGYTWVTIPVGLDVSIRRVMLVHEGKGVRIVTLTLEGADICASATDRDTKDTASERVAVSGNYTAVTVSVNGTWILDVLRGGLQLGLTAGKVMLRPTSDDWRYVQMGYRS